VPKFGKGGSVGDSGFWCWSVFGTESVHLFLPFKANTPARIYRIWQKYWAGPPNVGTIHAFAYIQNKATWTTNLIHGDDIPADKLTNTNWKDSKDPIAGALIPNFFIAYFGQDLSHGDLSNEEIMVKLVCLGSGCELWANTANAAVEYVDNILAVMDEIKAPELIK
jgi:hypothetical protein